MRDLNLIDYEISKHVAMRDIHFAALIAAALRRADSENFARLESVFPDIASDLKLRYNAPGGILLKDNIENYDETLKRVKEVANSYLESF